MVTAAPPPPPRPGVRPPFVAPPTDGARHRRWIGVATGVGALVACVTAVVVGIGVLISAGEYEYRNQATQVVAEYLGDLAEGHYVDAYALVCSEDQAGQSLPDFQSGNEAQPLSGYRVHPAQLVGAEARVTADLTYADGHTDTVVYPVVLENGEVEVCP